MELKVGLFVTIGVALIMLAVLLLGGANNIFSRNNNYFVHFPSVDGLIVGSKVVYGGLHIGTVHSIDLDPETKDLKVAITVAKKYEVWIKKDSVVEIMTQGVLGDKFLSIIGGSNNSPILADNSTINTRPTQGLAQFLTKGDNLMVSLNSIALSLDKLLKAFESKNRSEIFFEGMSETAKNLSSTTKKLSDQIENTKIRSAINNFNSILEKINNGTGTLGALVNDPGLYYDAKTLMGGANRNRIMRNLVRKTVKDADQEEAKEEAKEDAKKK